MPATLTCRNCGHKLTGAYSQTMETPFPDLLKLESNRVLSAALSDIAHNAVSVADQVILRLEAELRCKRSERRAFVNAHEAFISPIRRTPPEIITEIFLYYLEGDLRSPVPLASICKRLRSIALSSPQLWASFKMAIRHDNVKSLTALAEMCLSRAGKYPLTINLTSHDELWANLTTSFTTMKPLLDVLVARSEQWWTVKLALPFDLIKYLSERATIGFDRLEKLTFGDTYYDDENVPMCFLAMPRLRCLQFAWLDSPAPQVPWQQLQELTFDKRMTARACLDVLAAASTLQKCQLGLERATDRQSTHTLPSITLSMLRCMSIIIYDEGNLVPFLSAISLPAIEEFSIAAPTDHLCHDDSPLALIGVADAVASMISHGSLLKLTLDMPSMTWDATPANTVAILRAAPKLLEINLVGTSAAVLSREFVDQFNRQGAHLVPELQTLNVAASWEQLDLSVAVDMIEGRCGPNHRSSLKQVILRGEYIKYALDDEPVLKSRLLLVQNHSGIDVQLIRLEDAEMI